MDAKPNVGRGRSDSWRAFVLIAALGAGACNQRVNLGDIGDGPASLLWKATFEPGNLSEWEGDGQGSNYWENNDPAFKAAVTSSVAHGGSLAGVVGASPMGSMPSISYLTRNQPTPPQAYYSAWFYVPATLVLATGQYLSLVHFRGSDGQNVTPLLDVNLYPLTDGSVAAQLYEYRTSADTQQFPTVTRFPLDRWVQLEVFVSQAVEKTGRVTVWQDGTQILDRPGIQTVVLMGSLQWDVGAASDGLASGPVPVDLDDAAISLARRGPDATF